MKNLPEKELKEIAIGLRSGRLMSDRTVPKDLLTVVFMPLALIGEKTRKQLLKDPPGMILGDLKDAGPRSINGYPSFFSCQFISRHDAKRVCDLIKALEAAEKTV